MSRGQRSCATGSRPFWWLVAGITLLYAVCVSFFYTVWLQEVPGFSASSFDVVLNAAMVLACLVLARASGLRPLTSLRASVALRRSALVLGYGALGVALVGTFIAAVGTGASAEGASGVGAAMTPAGIRVAGVAAGAGMGLAVPVCFEAVSGFSRQRVAWACGLMSLVGMVLSLLIELLPTIAVAPCYAVVLAGSALCLARSGVLSTCREAAEAGRGSRDDCDTRDAERAMRGAVESAAPLDVLLVPAICTLALSMVYGVIDALAFGKGPSPEVSLVISQAGGIVAALLFLLLLGRGAEPRLSSMFNVVFGLLATGILLLPFLPAPYAVALNALTAAGWKLVMLALFYLVIVLGTGSRVPLLAGVAIAYALPRAGLFVGATAARIVGAGAGVDFVRLVCIAFFLLYLVMMVIWLVNYHERRRAEAQARQASELLGHVSQSQGDARRARCAVVAHEHGLTEREADVLALLAQGRDTASICEALSLSKNTVKSYRKDIYLKLGVHNRQEIIDLVGEGPGTEA